MLLRPRYLRRYRQIAEILADYGFGAALAQFGLSERLNLPRAWRRKKAADEELTNARRLRLAIEEMGPTFIKFGQILSTRSDLLPPDFIQELSYLQDRVAPVSWDQAQAVVESELGGPVEDFFAAVDPVPIASASLAQVHVATLLNGQEVVIKVQRPNIEATINTDLDIIYDLAQQAQQRTGLGSRYEVAEVAEEFAFSLRNELNFLREARSLDRFRENFTNEPQLYVPKVYWDLTTHRLLVLERIRGIKIDDLAALDAAGYNRTRLADYAARIVLQEVLIDGFFHADPHPGNILILPGEVICMLDFGTMGRLDESDRLNLARLFIAVVQLDVESTIDQLQRMGIADYKVNRAGLYADLRRLMRQYHGVPIYDINAREVLNELQPIIYDYKLHVPTDYWLLIKTAVIMQGVGLALDPDFDIFKAAQPFLGKIFRQLWFPSSWAPGLMRLGLDWKDLAAQLPRQAIRLMDQLDRGDFTVQARLPQLEPLINRVERWVHQVIYTILLAALLIGLAFLVPHLNFIWPWKLTTWIIMGGFLVLVILMARLVWSFFRAGKWKID
ncbi:MAG TPA: AarF/ABC1/UbiB kinase family protein [Anaerolineales bacterium]|nr:AarF/ABC1/UbiB kinase family protein [Anaerolineales bacterium]